MNDALTPRFADEIVTRARLRFIPVPGLARSAALITLDNGLDYHKPNTFGPAGLASLAMAIDDALAAQPAFIAVTGKPYIFCVGADLTGVGLLSSRDQALEIGQLGHQVFAKLRNSTIPTFAFVNGAALGGGLELALHCHYRSLSSSVAALGLPEVGLGLIPGWGGSQLLPNLVGIVNAAQVIVSNPLMQKMLRPAQAAEMGLGDVLLEPADFLERSLEWAAEVVSGRIQVSRPEVDRSAMWDAVLDFAKSQLDERLHGAPPAPYRALELLRLAKTAPFAEGIAAEEVALADLLMGEELRSGIYAFDLVQRRAKRPAGAPNQALARDVTKVGIVGAGLMASQLALLFLRRLEVPVVMTDLDQARVDKGLGYVRAELDKLVSKHRLSRLKADKLRNLISGSVDRGAFADASFVVEAVFEELAVKKQVWAELEQIVTSECVLATNTSSLSVSAMAAELRHPERVVGFHFFNPVAIMPLVEIIRAERTDDASLATAFAVGKALRKSCVLVKDAPAFVVNRLLTRFLGEIIGAIDAGTPAAIADAALDPLGLPLRPLALLQLVGPMVAYHVGGTLQAAFPARFSQSENLRRIAESGLPLLVDNELNPQLVGVMRVGDQPLSAEAVRERAVRALAQEIGLMLAEGVVIAAQDVDLCMILGAGWPFHLGGVTPYLDRTGVSVAVNSERFLPFGVASLPPV